MPYAIALGLTSALYYAMAFWMIGWVARVFGYPAIANTAYELASFATIILAPVLIVSLVVFAVTTLVERWRAQHTDSEQAPGLVSVPAQAAMIPVAPARPRTLAVRAEVGKPAAGANLKLVSGTADMAQVIMSAAALSRPRAADQQDAAARDQHRTQPVRESRAV